MLKFLPTVSNKMALRLLKWSEFFYTFLLILPVIVVLYQNKGITVGDFFLIQGLSSMVAMKPLLDIYVLTGATIIAGAVFLIMLLPLKKVLDIIRQKLV